MKKLAFLLFATFFLWRCEKTELAPVEPIDYEPITWKLDAINYTLPNIGSFAQNSERTLRFWNGKVLTNGSFCDFTGDTGPLQEADYDRSSQTISYPDCLADTTTFSGNWSYQIDQFYDYLIIFPTRDSTPVYRFLSVEE